MILSTDGIFRSVSSFGLRLGLVSCATLVSLACASCQHSGTALPDQPTASTAVKLSAGDVIKVSFPGAPDLTQTQKIRADGKVNLPLVGEATASRKTLSDFQSELIRLYKSQLRNNDVVVTLESGTVNVVVSGYVSKPGKISFDRPTTVFQAIMEAGGATQYGNIGNVRLIRTVNGQQNTQVINLKSALRGQSADVTYVKDGDVIYVPQSLF